MVPSYVQVVMPDTAVTLMVLLLLKTTVTSQLSLIMNGSSPVQAAEIDPINVTVPLVGQTPSASRWGFDCS